MDQKQIFEMIGSQQVTIWQQQHLITQLQQQIRTLQQKNTEATPQLAGS